MPVTKTASTQTPSRLRRMGGVVVPAAGLAAMAVSASALSALAAAFPEAGNMAGLAGSCDPASVDFGCGHGFGCLCHLLPGDGPKLD